MFPLHPAIVHFPIALLLVSLALDLAGMALRRADLARAGLIAFALGSIGAAASALSGPEEAVRDAAALPALHRHEAFAAATIALCLALFWLRIGHRGGRRARGKLLSLTLSLLTAASIAATGYYGGRLVYDHAVGIAALHQGAASARGDEAPQEALAKVGAMLLLLSWAVWALQRLRGRLPHPVGARGTVER
ncbi:MAG: DUF2231 domain-containing protein [Thermomicrobiaceae bacterium]|nr:DUF2231 domain-containing protein [Thermomicrobiaceae bacterium]